MTEQKLVYLRGTSGVPVTRVNELLAEGWRVVMLGPITAPIVLGCAEYNVLVVLERETP